MKQLLVALVCVACCGLSSCKCSESRLVTDIKVCVIGEVAAKWPTLKETVKTILQNGAVNWQEQLKALEVMGVDTVVCAAHAAIEELKILVSSKLKVSPTAAPDPAVQRGLSYLKAKGIK